MAPNDAKCKQRLGLVCMHSFSCIAEQDMVVGEEEANISACMSRQIADTVNTLYMLCRLCIHVYMYGRLSRILFKNSHFPLAAISHMHAYI